MAVVKALLSDLDEVMKVDEASRSERAVIAT